MVCTFDDISQITLEEKIMTSERGSFSQSHDKGDIIVKLY